MTISAVILASLLVSFMGSGGGRPAPRSLKDGTQVRLIHTAMLAFAAENGDRYQTSSLVALRMSPSAAKFEDDTLNHTAAFYSMMIAQNLFPPDWLVSPVEINPLIVPRKNYDFDAYDPAAGVLWDRNFVMRLDDPSIGANSSYAHVAFCGDRVGNLTNYSAAPFLPIIGTRGVRGGVGPGHLDHDNSLTLQLFGSPKTWDGNICFSDNHVEFLSTFTPPGVTYRGSLSAEPQADNIFATEFAHPRGNQAAADAFLGIFTESTKDTVKDVYDTDAPQRR